MADLSIGTTIAGYRIEAVLGRGSMGTVYSALDVALERRVALKLLIPELSRDERFQERFLRESKLAASLEHPHIVPVHAAGEADGILFMAMRYVEGRDLAELLGRIGHLDPDRALDILAQVAGALDAAHAHGLVHRDVKQANILLADYGGSFHVYLCDFGLAKHASTIASLTGSRAIIGTVDYLAPEQVNGQPVGGQADVYALGCVFYECLTGARPFARENELASSSRTLRTLHRGSPIVGRNCRRSSTPSSRERSPRSRTNDSPRAPISRQPGVTLFAERRPRLRPSPQRSRPGRFSSLTSAATRGTHGSTETRPVLVSRPRSPSGFAKSPASMRGSCRNCEATKPLSSSGQRAQRCALRSSCSSA